LGVWFEGRYEEVKTPRKPLVLPIARQTWGGRWLAALRSAVRGTRVGSKGTHSRVAPRSHHCEVERLEERPQLFVLEPRRIELHSLQS